MSFSPRQEVQEAVREIRRRGAVTAGAELFARDGYHATSMAAIARHAGLSLKALYETFPGKDELLAAVLADVATRFAGLFEAPAHDETPVAALLAFIDRLLTLMGENPDALRLYARGKDGIPITVRERGADTFAAYTDRVLVALTSLFAPALGPAAPTDPELLAHALFAAMVAEARARVESGGSPQECVAAMSELALVLVRGGSSSGPAHST